MYINVDINVDITMIMHTNLIGISGKIGSGKTTLVNEILRINPEYKKYSFAENLRKVICILTNIDIEKTRSEEDKNVYLEEWDLTVGQLLQKVGTEVVRSAHKDAWVISTFSDYDRYNSTVRIYDDVRFENEANAIKKRGGYLIRLNGTPGGPPKTKRDLNHISETSLDNYQNFDLTVDTDEYIDKVPELYKYITDKIRERETVNWL